MKHPTTVSYYHSTGASSPRNAKSHFLPCSGPTFRPIFSPGLSIVIFSRISFVCGWSISRVITITSDKVQHGARELSTARSQCIVGVNGTAFLYQLASSEVFCEMKCTYQLAVPRRGEGLVQGSETQDGKGIWIGEGVNMIMSEGRARKWNSQYSLDQDVGSLTYRAWRPA